jgi:hypothetical protein
MSPEQAYELETLQRITGSSDGDMLRLARECAQDPALDWMGEMSRSDAGEMIEVLRTYRYYRDVAALDRVRERMYN